MSRGDIRGDAATVILKPTWNPPMEKAPKYGGGRVGTQFGPGGLVPESEDAPRRRQLGVRSIRSKLLLALAVPVLIVAGITAVQASQAQRSLNSTKDEVELAIAAGGPSTLTTSLLDERNLTALDLLGLSGAVQLTRFEGVPDDEKLDRARAHTDEALEETRSSVEASTAQVRELYLPILDELTGALTAVREQIDAFPGERNLANEDVHAVAVASYGDYSDLIDGLLEANEIVITDLSDAELHNRASSLAAQSRTGNFVSLMLRETALPALGVASFPNLPEMQELLTDYRLSERKARAGVAADPQAAEIVDAYYDRESTETFLTLYDYITRQPEEHKVGPENLAKFMAIPADPTVQPNDGATWTATAESVQRRGDSLISDARTSRNIYVAIFLLATVLSVVIAILIARSIARPLLSISEQADEMANVQLPAAVQSVLATPLGRDVVPPRLEPIVVDTNDEVADVAESINDVQRRVVDLALEQAMQRRNFADTFLNLGRRIQGLVARQLDFITELEDAEDDPQALEDLFQLDHLATRMRRNAESLVVLAGVTRQQRRGAPTPMIDVMRTALGEVDQYTRVQIGDVDDTLLPTSVAGDLAHILAELIENGLEFSPADADVEVDGERAAETYRVTVVDHGVGMDPDQIATANRRLAGHESFTVAPSRYMGHFVAGHLASALGISVELAAGANGGTRATVELPANLLIDVDPTPEPPDAADEPGGDDDHHS